MEHQRQHHVAADVLSKNIPATTASATSEEPTSNSSHQVISSPSVLNLSSEDQIAEAKKRAMMYAQSLKEAREYEAKALKALEQERTKWIYDHEEKSVKIEQLERELASAVDVIEQQRSAPIQPTVAYSVPMVTTLAVNSATPLAVDPSSRAPVVPNSTFLPGQMPLYSTTQSLYQKPLTILDQHEIQTDFRKVLSSSQSPLLRNQSQSIAHASTSSSQAVVQPNPVYSTIPLTPMQTSASINEQFPHNVPNFASSSKNGTAESNTWNELLNQYKDQLLKARGDISQLMTEKKHLANRVLELTNTATKLAEDKEQLRIKITDLEARLQFRSNQVREYETEKLNHEQSEREIAAKLESNQTTISSLEAHISILENENKIALQSINSLETQLNVAKQVNNNLESKMGDLQIQVVDKDFKIKQWETKFKDTEDEYSKDLLEMKHTLNSLQLQLARAEIMQIQPNPTIQSPMMNSYNGHTPTLQLPSQQHQDMRNIHYQDDHHTGPHSGTSSQQHQIHTPVQNSSSHGHSSTSKPIHHPDHTPAHPQIHSLTHHNSAHSHLDSHTHSPAVGFHEHHSKNHTPFGHGGHHGHHPESATHHVPSQTTTPLHAKPPSGIHGSTNHTPSYVHAMTPKSMERSRSQSQEDLVSSPTPKATGIAARSPIPSTSKHVVTIPSPNQPSISVDDSDLSLSVDLGISSRAKSKETDQEKKLKKVLKKKGLHSLKSKSGDSTKVARSNSGIVRTPTTGKASMPQTGTLNGVTPSTTDKRVSRSQSHDSLGKRLLNRDSIDSHRKPLLDSNRQVETPQSVVTRVAKHEIESTAKKMTRKVPITPTPSTPKTPATHTTAELHRTRSLDSTGKKRLK